MNLKQFQQLIAKANLEATEWSMNETIHVSEVGDSFFILVTSLDTEAKPKMVWIHIDQLSDFLAEHETVEFDKGDDGFLLEKFMKFILKIGDIIKFKTPFAK